MRIHLAADHRGYQLGRQVYETLRADGHELAWHGADVFDDGDDYPVFAVRVAQAVVADQDAGIDARGIFVVGSAAGPDVAASKVNGARAVPALTAGFVVEARTRADANVLILPADSTSAEDATALIALFLGTEFSSELDDARRLLNISEYENAGTIEGWLIDPINHD